MIKMVVYAVIPLKSLSSSKTRLSSVLDGRQMRLLTLTMLKNVLEATFKSRVIAQTVVISSDQTVLQLAERLGADRIQEVEEGLNQAVIKASRWCSERGVSSMLVIPADLPLLISEDLDSIVSMSPPSPSIVISPSYDGGTNLLLCTPPDVITPQFGPNSFMKHISIASSKGASVKVYNSQRVVYDVDLPNDLAREPIIQKLGRKWLKELAAAEGGSSSILQGVKKDEQMI